MKKIRPWRISLDRVQNGIIIRFENENSPISVNVIEENKNDDESLAKAKIMYDLIFEIINFFALYSSKHDKYRLDVKIINQKSGEEIEMEI